MILGIDISHHQGTPDLAAVAGAGRRFVVAKATEGTGWTDPALATSRAAAHAAGLLVGLYHLARAGDAEAEAAAFARAVGPLRPGEFTALDWEVEAPDPVGWCAAWLAAARAALGPAPLVYLNRSTRDRFDWRPVVQGGAGLWLAAWDGRTDPVPPGPWPVLAVKQYSDAGRVPGIDGPVDLDVFYGSEEQLRAYGAGPGREPAG